MSDFWNFDIVFERLHAGQVSVEVRFDGEVHREEIAFGGDDEEVERYRAGLARALARPHSRDGSFAPVGAAAAEASDADLPGPLDFGRWLFATFFTGKVGRSWAVASDRATRADAGIRLRMVFSEEAASLGSLPWELLFDADRQDPMVLYPRTPVVRCLEVGKEVRRPVLDGPLRILMVTSNPLKDLDVEAEEARIHRALEKLVDRSVVAVEPLRPPTLAALEARLARRDDPVHVVHFIGHGDFDEGRAVSLLLLEDGEGGMHPVPAASIATVLDFHPSAALVVLNSCEGAKGDDGDVFSSAAARLTADGVTAVVAMTHEVSDRAAIEFATAFYRTLAEESLVDVAVHRARSAIRAAFDDTVEWATPALFLRSPDGRLFSAPEPGDPAMGQMVSLLCDRLRQAREFDRFLDAAEERHDGVPLVCVVPSRPEELPTSFVQRLIDEKIRRAASRMRPELGMSERSVVAEWPGPGETGRRREDLLYALEEAANILVPGSNARADTAAEFAGHPAFRDRPVVVVEHDLNGANWTDDSPAFVSWYVNDFWGALAPDADRPLFIVFLRVIYAEGDDAPAGGGRFGGLLRRLRGAATATPAAIRQALDDTLGAGTDPKIPTLVLEDLHPLGIEHVQTWWRQNNLRGDLFTDAELQALFADQPLVPMNEVEPHLKRIYDMHRQEELIERGLKI